MVDHNTPVPPPSLVRLLASLTHLDAPEPLAPNVAPLHVVASAPPVVGHGWRGLATLGGADKAFPTQVDVWRGANDMAHPWVVLQHQDCTVTHASDGYFTIMHKRGFTQHLNDVAYAALSATLDARLVTIEGDTLLVRDKVGNSLLTQVGHARLESSALGLAIHPNGHQAATVHAHGVQLWHLPSLAPTRIFALASPGSDAPTSVRFLPDGLHLLVGQPTALVVHNLAQQSIAWSLVASAAPSAAIAPLGLLVPETLRDGDSAQHYLFVWSFSGTLRDMIKSPQPITQILVSSDGDWAVGINAAQPSTIYRFGLRHGTCDTLPMQVGVSVHQLLQIAPDHRSVTFLSGQHVHRLDLPSRPALAGIGIGIGIGIDRASLNAATRIDASGGRMAMMLVRCANHQSELQTLAQGARWTLDELVEAYISHGLRTPDFELFAERAWRGHPQRIAYQAGLAAACVLRFCAAGDVRQFHKVMAALHDGLARLQALAGSTQLWPAGLHDFWQVANNIVDVAGACDNLRRHWLTAALVRPGDQGWNEHGWHFALGLGIDPSVGS